MSFLFGVLAGTIFSVIVGMVLFHLYGKSQHGPEVNSLKKIFLSVPFLSLLIFSLVCLSTALIVEQIFLTTPSKEVSSFLASPKTWLAFSKELFFAAFIALIIIVVVEVASNDEQAELMEEFKGSQEKLIDKAQKSVFEGVYKNAVDAAIFEEVVDSIFTADFVREEHHRSIVLEPITDRDDILLMKVKQTYTVKNVTKNIKTSNQRFYLPNTRHADGDLNQFSRLSITSEKGENNSIPETYPYSKGSETERESEQPCDTDIPAVEPSASGAETIYTFPAVKVQGGGVIRVELELQLVKDVSDNEILTFLSPTLKGSFSVHSYIPELELKAISLHRGSLVEMPDGGEDFKRWTFSRPMLPFQGYVVMWSKT